MGEEDGFLGRYRQAGERLSENREREFLGWLKPGESAFSLDHACLLVQVLPLQKYGFTTTTNGSHRAMVPIGMYEDVMPLDVMPTFLLRALVVDDVERAEALGALELVEEDLSLCSFVSPGKEDFGVALRRQPRHHLEGRLMKALRKLLDNQAHLFEEGGKFEKFEALYEAPDTLLFTPGHVTQGDVHVRDGLDLKRMMITVVAALDAVRAMAFYNTGYQANLAVQIARDAHRRVAD